MESIYKSLRRNEAPGYWRYLTFSCYHRLSLLDTPSLRDNLAASIANARTRCQFLLRAWVIMPNHVHLILKPTSVNWPVSKILIAIKQPHAQSTLREWRRTSNPHLKNIVDESGTARYWQPGGGFDRNIRDEQELTREIEYVHDNPVTRELVTDRCDWTWSSARWYAGVRDNQISIDL